MEGKGEEGREREGKERSQSNPPPSKNSRSTTAKVYKIWKNEKQEKWKLELNARRRVLNASALKALFPASTVSLNFDLLTQIPQFLLIFLISLVFLRCFYAVSKFINRKGMRS